MKTISIQKSMSWYQIEWNLPMRPCQAAKRLMNIMPDIEYLSNRVKYDTGGSDLLKTHLKETLESKIV